MTVRCLAGALLFSATMGASGIARAEEAASPADAAMSAVVEIGKITSKNLDPNACKIVMLMQFDEVPAKMAIFREAWLNRDYSRDFYVQRQRQVFSFSIAKRYAALVTEGLYHNNDKVSVCRFVLNADYSDTRGQNETIEVLSYRFDRKLFNSINWDRFDARNFQTVAIDFHIGPGVSDWVKDEPSMADPKPRQEASQCDMLLFNANAIFIRATTFCKKDYMDSAAGLKALAGARACMGSMEESTIKDKAGKSMLRLDAIAARSGKRKVCDFVEEVARQVAAH